jgi:Tfp pilus assembly protein PilO
MSGGLLCILVLAWFCLSVLAQRVSQETNNLREAQITIEANYRQQQNLSNLSRQVTSIQENAEELNRAFADRTKALTFVEYIEETAAKYGIEHVFTPVEPTRTGSPSQTQYLIEERGFKLTLKGKTQDLFRFLAELEANPIYVLTTDASLNRDDGGNASLDLQGTIPWH